MSETATKRPSLCYSVDASVEHMTRRPDRPMPRRAANIGVITPLLLLGVGLLLRVILRTPSNPVGIPVTEEMLMTIIKGNAFVCAVGFFCALLGLFGGYPFRGLVGFLLNGLVGAGCILLMWVMPATLTTARLVGHWDNMREHMTLRPDLTAEITVTGATRTTFTGRWVALPTSWTGGDVQLVFTPSDARIKVITWQILDSTQTHLTLKDGGRLDFERTLR